MFGAGSTRIKEKYVGVAYLLGEQIAENNHTLVYGGGADGLMGATARGAKDNDAEVIAIVPKWIDKFERIYDEADEIVYTEGMNERKNLFLEKSDAFVILPGGLGTMDEVFEIMVLKKLKKHNKPIIILNCFNYYNSLLTMISDMIDERTIVEDNTNIYEIIDNVEDIIPYLEEYDYDDEVDYSF